MSTAEIIAELAHLSPTDLATVRAWLDRQATSPKTPELPPRTSPRIHSPRLVDPNRARDFTKQIVKSEPNAAV